MCGRALPINKDLNLVYHAKDNNKNILNHRLMGQIKRFLNDAFL
jgi:hypothetical protein